MAGEHLETQDGVTRGFVSFGSNGGTVDGYLVKPEDGQAHPGVVMIQEWWGVEDHIKELAERLARQGYTVLAPDLYHGKVVDEPDEAGKAMMALNKGAAVQEIGKAVAYLKTRGDARADKIGVVGFCMGGMLAWKAAETQGGAIAAVAAFYGAGYHPGAEEMAKVTAPALVVWGGQDGSIPPADREHIASLLQQQGKTHKTLLYPNAGHAFMNDKHGDLEPESAQQAWGELVAWFKQYLG
ncbi:MAG TPA: dienelactone hydrolase family protein [Ktedonobacterales bacterium]|nr:dienelactone hydrolase family protein [Ktedonobacterales bacterium]